MKLTVLSKSRGVIESLSSQPFLPDAGLSATVEKPQRVPGAVGSAWQLLVDLAVVGAPMSVVVNLLSDWIISALRDTPLSDKVRIVFRQDGRTTEIELSGTVSHEIIEAVAKAIGEIHRKS